MSPGTAKCGMSRSTTSARDEDADLDFLAYVAGKVSTIQDDLGSVERVFDAAIQRHFEGKKIERQQVDLFVEDERKTSPEKTELGQSSVKDIDDLTKRARELLETTESPAGHLARGSRRDSSGRHHRRGARLAGRHP